MHNYTDFDKELFRFGVENSVVSGTIALLLRHASNKYSPSRRFRPLYPIPKGAGRDGELSMPNIQPWLVE